MEYLKQFQTRIIRNDLSSIVCLWQEYCLGDNIDEEEFKQILIEIKNSSLSASFGCYVEQSLILVDILPENETVHEIIKLIFDIQNSNSSTLADFAINYLIKRYPNDKEFQNKIRLVGLREKKSFPCAISNFEILTHMKIGNFFIHTGGLGAGEVVDVSTLREQLSIEFEHVAGQKDISFKNAFTTLIPISKDHFLARRFGDHENFEIYAKNHPTETIRILLRDMGPKTAQEIKDELCGFVIPQKEWARWWQTTRTKLKKDLIVDTPKSLKEEFRLRKNEITHEEKLKKILETESNVDMLIEIIYSFIRDFPQTLKNEDVKILLKNKLSDMLLTEITNGQEAQILFILQTLGHEKAQNLSSIISKFTDIKTIIDEIHVISYKKRLLVEIKNSRQNWEEIFSNIFLSIDQNPLRDYILEQLLESDKSALLNEKIKQLIDFPNSCPQAFLWYFQKIISNDTYPFSDQSGKNAFLESFFILLRIIECDQSYREMTKKMLAFLSGERFLNVRKIFQKADIETVKEVLLLSTKCQSISDHDIKILHSLAQVVHPSLAKQNHMYEDNEEHVIWTTCEGYQKVKDRIQQIATTETIENAKEIEIARAYGDLRENSEYKFALEKRSRLQSELHFLSNQIKQMRILTKEDIDTNQISVGCVVHLENIKGEKTKYIFLGPWDAKPEENILSIQSKIAQEMAGKTINSTCCIKEKEWFIKSIESYL